MKLLTILQIATSGYPARSLAESTVTELKATYAPENSGKEQLRVAIMVAEREDKSINVAAEALKEALAREQGVDDVIALVGPELTASVGDYRLPKALWDDIVTRHRERFRYGGVDQD